MPRYSNYSKRNLATGHGDLQEVFNQVILGRDCQVTCGSRGRAKQEKAYASGNSKAKYGESPHNFEISLAVDVHPYPINYDDIDRYKAFGNYVKGVADAMGIDIEWGGDWLPWSDDPNDKDWGHFQIANWRSLRP